MNPLIQVATIAGMEDIVSSLDKSQWGEATKLVRKIDIDENISQAYNNYLIAYIKFFGDDNDNYLPIDTMTNTDPPMPMPASGWSKKATALIGKLKKREEEEKKQEETKKIPEKVKKGKKENTWKTI